MDDAQRTALAEKLGLPEDATPEQINTALQDNALADPPAVDESGSNAPAGEKGEKPKPYPPVGTGPADPNEEGTEGPAGTAEAGVKVNDDGTVTLDKEAYAHLKSGADTALASATTERNRSIGEIVEAAIKVGKFPPARREHYTALATADFDGTKEFIDKLEPGAVPVNMRGTTGDGDEPNVGGDGGGEGLPKEWFRNSVRATGGNGSRVTQAKEG